MQALGEGVEETAGLTQLVDDAQVAARRLVLRVAGSFEFF